MNNLIVRIYVNNISTSELQVLLENMSLSEKQNFELDLRQNEEFDPLRTTLFPDGFLYFPNLIEYYKNENLEASDITNTKEILLLLWQKGFSAIAACNFEDDLPEHGGYKSKSIPWQ